MSAQDPAVFLAQKLAGNEKKIRDRAVRKLRRYLRARSSAETGGFSEEELTKIWKGLFYCLWMQDKPLLQEELANTTSQLIHALQTGPAQQLFLKTFWQTLSREWNGIDRLRLDKFYTLARLVLRRSVELLRKAEWEESHVEEFLTMLTQEVLLEGTRGVQFHLIDIYLDELAQVGAAELPADLNLRLIEPFCKMAAKIRDPLLLQAVFSGIFQAILDQAPFAIEDLMRELKETSADSDSDSPEAAEALWQDAEDIGPVLQFDYSALADRLFTLASKTYTPAHNRKRLYRLVKQFRDLIEGVFPQDDFPDDVSTDEDDDEFSSWRFRKRQKRAQAREAQLCSKGSADSEDPEDEKQKRRKRKKEDSELSDAPSPPDSITQVMKKRKSGVGVRSAAEVSHPAVNGVIDPHTNTHPDHPGTSAQGPDFSSLPKSALKIKMKKRRRAGLLSVGLSVLSSGASLLARRRRVLQHRGRSLKMLFTANEQKAAAVVSETLIKIADTPKATVKAADTPKATTKAADTPKATTKAADTPKATVKAAGTPKATVKAADTPKATTKAADTPKATTKAAGTPKATVKAADTPKATTKAADTPKATVKAAGTPKATTKAADIPKATVKAADIPKATVKAADTPKATVKAADTPKATVKAADTPKATVKAADTPKARKKAVKTRLTQENADVPAAKIQPKGTLGHEEFVSFCKGDAPKPVFVKTAKRKGGQVHTKSIRKSKKVTFSLKQNMTAEFKRTDRSLLVSPTGSYRVPFNPEQKPQHGVLKTPAKSPRPRAADFF